MDDGCQGSDLQFPVIRDRNRYGGTLFAELHNYVTAFLADLSEPVFLQNSAYFLTGKNAEFTHVLLQNA